MSIKYNAEILFKDTAGVRGKTVLKNIPEASAPDMTKLLTLVTGLKAKVNAGINAYSLLQWEYAAFSGTLATKLGLNSIKALINIAYVYDSQPVTSMLFLPNPAAAHFAQATGEGLRMLQSSLDDLSSALSTMAGFTVTAIEGKIVSKSWKKRASPTGCCVVFQDQANVNGYLTLPSVLVPDAAALNTFTGEIDTNAFSDSLVTGSYFLGKQEALPDPASGIGLAAEDTTKPTPFSSAETRAIVNLAYEVDDLRKYEKISLPAVKSASLQLVRPGSSKYKVSTADGAGIATLLTTFYGSGNRTLTFSGSRIVGKNLDPQ